MSDIKVVSVDMDGTFLDNNNYYDRERFNKILNVMLEKGVKFVVASGNQYAHLKSIFPGLDDKIYYISENGAMVSFNNEILISYSFTKDLAFDIAFYLKKELEVEFLACAEDAAYINAEVPKHVKDYLSNYYDKLKDYNTIADIPIDRVFKYALGLPKVGAESFTNAIKDKFFDKADVITSGFSTIDIMSPGTNKAKALNFLLNTWDIQPENLMAFGDSNNDYDMLKLAKYSYAMGNANENIKSIAKYIAKSNNEFGVLEVLERTYLDNKNGDNK